MTDPWNTLEVTKLCISLLTPIVVAVIAFLLNKRLKELEKRQWTNQKILEKRLAIYDKIVPLLNDILCFNCYIGNWKDLSPIEIIKTKRVLDKELNIYKPLFDPEVWDSYNIFIHLCFDTFCGWGRDATIRSTFNRREEYLKEWDKEWCKLFSEKFIERVKIEAKYEEQQNEKKMNAYAILVEKLKDNVEIFHYDSIKKIKLPQNINGQKT